MKQKTKTQKVKDKILRKLEGNKINIIQEKIAEDTQDSFFYDGFIAEAQNQNGTEFNLIACGEIRIFNKEGNLVYDGKERGDGIKGGINNDKDLEKIGNDYNDNYYWENNNWFEVIFKLKDESCFESVIGDIAHTYNEAIELLKSYLESEDY